MRFIVDELAGQRPAKKLCLVPADVTIGYSYKENVKNSIKLDKFI